MTPPRARTISGIAWHAAELQPITVVAGPEELFADRAVARIVALAKACDPEVEVSRLDAADYQAGDLNMLATPSLFAEPRAIIIENGEQGGNDLAKDLAAVRSHAPEDVWLVLCHRGGNRGKAVREAAGQAQIVACDLVTTPQDKLSFVNAEFRRAQRTIATSAARGLVDAVGAELRELSAACAQLIADTAGAVRIQDVDRYYGGRVEVTAFKVADAVAQGELSTMVGLVRHCLAVGIEPVPILAAVAVKLRTLVKVGYARSRKLDAAKEFGLAQWQVDRAGRELTNWTPAGLAAAISYAAAADAEIKGASRDPGFALERALIRMCQASRHN